MTTHTRLLFRAASTIVLVGILPAIAVAQPLGSYAGKGKSVTIYHSKYDFGHDHYYERILSVNLAEAVAKDTTQLPLQVSNAYVSLFTTSFAPDTGFVGAEYYFFGDAAHLSPSFSTVITSNGIPSDVSIQGSIQVCGYYWDWRGYRPDCVDISTDAIVKHIGRELRRRFTGQSWDPETRTIGRFDGYESVGLATGTIAVSGEHNTFTIQLGESSPMERTDSYLFSTREHTITVERHGP